MGDIPIHESPVPWRILPPPEVRVVELFTVVAQFDEKIYPQVLESFVLDESGPIDERIHGSGQHTGPDFNDDRKSSTYVWFNIRVRRAGKFQLKFRLTWRLGHHLYGTQATFDIEARHKAGILFYCTDDQDLLALLEPYYYDPTPIELMEENADPRHAPPFLEEEDDDDVVVKTE